MFAIFLILSITSLFVNTCKFEKYFNIFSAKIISLFLYDSINLIKFSSLNIVDILLLE